MATPVNRINISDLDFDQIKTNLKTFLRSQEEFRDYDFEGAGLNILLDILAYNTHYNAYYLNMVANESFLDTSILRSSVVSHAKTLGYVPYSAKASVATINMTVDAINEEESTLTVPRGTVFRSERIDNKTFQFTVLEEAVADRVNDEFLFENLEIYQGELVSYRYVYDSTSNPNSIYTLPDTNIDTSTIKVSVQHSVSNTDITTFNYVQDILDVDSTSNVYFLQEGRNGLFQIYFGDGVVGKKLEDGEIVNVTYLITSAEAGNGFSRFTLEKPITSHVDYTVEVLQSSTAGAPRETVDEVKLGAVSQYTQQNRLVTTNDFEAYIKRNYPNIKSISVWGGEEETNKVYGKVYICMSLNSGYYLSETEKQRIIDSIVNPKSIVSISAEIVDPEFLYVLVSDNVKYDPKKTSLSPNSLANLVKDVILEYNTTSLGILKSGLILSRLVEQIDDTDKSIIGNCPVINLQKRFSPTLNKISSYKINFNVPLRRGSSNQSRMTSNQFNVRDSVGTIRSVILEEIPQSSSGITSIRVVNSGSGYLEAPTVTIIGDGYGAEAEATIVNGKVDSITITKRGFDYTRAIVEITSDSGTGAIASAVSDASVGELRTIYYNANVERKVVDGSAGTINYETGEVVINDINILEVLSSDGLIRLTTISDTGLIEGSKNTILTIDESDPSSIEINMIQE
jgi:hypothetical protein